MRKTFILLISGLLAASGASAEVLTLDECRRMALENNKALQMASAEKRAAYYQRKSAFTNYLPKISAAGGYMFTSREISLLDDEQKQTLPHIGDGVAAGAQQAAGALMQHPQLGPMLQGMQGQLGTMVKGLQSQLNGAGQSIVDALDTDTRNAAAITLQLTQPIYMGGKIVAYNKIARLAEQAADDKLALAQQDVLVEVDETYWQIVALTAKRDLAESYLNLVKDLEKDVDAMIAEGVATKADGLSVKVKANQADVALIQVNNGLSLLKMLLCQILGIDVNTPVTLADETMLDNLTADSREIAASYDEAWRQNRPELRALGRSAEVFRQKERLALAETMPTVALTGGYSWLTPGLFNGFQNKFNGLWNVGVVVKIPLITWGDRFYKVKAARANTQVARLKLEEATEKIELQISQSRNSLEESRQRLLACESAGAVADENLRIATLGLSEGVIPVINVNEAQTAWLGARSALIAAKIDLKLAHIHLQRALGTINNSAN